MEYDQLKLSNQLCFPIYAASRLVIREYQPFLEKLGITYPQYLVLMVLWEKDDVSVNSIANKLILNTNTLTPLLKRMEQQGLVARSRSARDERKVIITLTEAGLLLKQQAATIPLELGKALENGPLQLEQLLSLKQSLCELIGFLSNQSTEEVAP